MNDARYRRHYSEAGLRRKLRRWAGSAGREVVELALQLYYAVRSPHTPMWARAVIYGALGYFIAPLDAVPDFTPVVGYGDDLGVLAAAVATVSLYITPDVRQRARERLARWFGDELAPGESRR